MKVSKSIFGFAAAAMFAGAGVAQAAPVTSVDFDTLTLGSEVDSMSSSFSGGLGDLDSTVYFNEQVELYTFVLTVTPAHNNISEFNTAFDVLGFTGTAGYSFSDAAAASGSADGAGHFIIEHDPDGTLDWAIAEINGGKYWFGIGDSITFFFQSTLAPNATDMTNMINGVTGSAATFAFVPTPTAAVIGLPMLGLLGLGRRRRAQN